MSKLISLEEGKAKLLKMNLLDQTVYNQLLAILERIIEITPGTVPGAVVKCIESRLAQEHLAYLKKDQVNTVWGTSTTAALKELCDNWSIAFNVNSPRIGQTVLLAILDGSKPSKNAVKSYVIGQPLAVRYYDQRDSETWQADRMCFSSSNAMLVEFEKPGTLHGYNGDDEYLARVNEYGDSTEAVPQVKALHSYGVNATMHYDLGVKDLEDQIKSGHPMPIGTLHVGPVDAPEGFGHWIIVTGITADGKGYFVNDPYGQMDTLNGGYTDSSKSGKNLIYSKEHLLKRWLVGGEPGWGIVV